MKQMLSVLISVFLMVISLCALGQQAGTVQTTAAESQMSAIQAVNLLQEAVTASGILSSVGPDLHIVGAGSIIYNWAGEQMPGEVSVTWSNSAGLETSSKTALGSRTQKADMKAETFADEKGKITTFGSHTGARSQLKYLPSIELQLVSNYTNIKLQSYGVVSINGQGADVVGLSGVWPTWGPSKSDQEVLFYLERTSHLPIRRDDYIEAAPGSPGRLLRSMTYSDYRKVGGVYLPFSITEALNDQKIYSLTFTSLTLN